MHDPGSPAEQPRCLVIGGARGIGAAIVERITADAGRCHATTRRHPAGTRPFADGSSLVTWSSCDVRDPKQIRRMVAEAVVSLERVDALVYCAGAAFVGPVEHLTPSMWDEVHEINVRGFGLAIQAALPHWRANGSGCAVVLSSQAARRSQPLISAYSASKAAVEGLVRALAIELAPVVRVNAVAPGIVPTDMITEDFARQAELDGNTVAAVQQRTLDRIPLGRLQPTSAVAAAVAFLISAAAADVTGHVLAVDGGMSA
jgi:NAD(P)-dependent dehydrogenase (short-subunit alcohol dehydrogenase family)